MVSSFYTLSLFPSLGDTPSPESALLSQMPPRGSSPDVKRASAAEFVVSGRDEELTRGYRAYLNFWDGVEDEEE